MKITLQTDKKKSKTEQKLENLLKLHDEYVEVGHFKDSGMHYSGMTYPELMILHHYGVPEKNIPPRPVLDILRANFHKPLSHPEVKKAFEKLSSTMCTKNDLITFLESVGEAIRDEEVDIFGSSRLTSNSRAVAASKPDGNTPLVDTQDLVKETSYKDSITKVRHKWRS